MVSVEQARELVIGHCNELHPEFIPLEAALGRTLASDILAPFPLPPFRQSAMDGYALMHGGPDSLRCIGEIPAGSDHNPFLAKDACIRIFTGARVPDGADTVVMQEWVTRSGDLVTLAPDRLAMVREGMNIRPVGEQIQAGEPCMLRGTRLNPAGLSFLRSFGIRSVEVFGLPRIGLLITGSELLRADQEQKDGSIYESNSVALSNALISNDFTIDQERIVPDDPAEIRDQLSALMEVSEVVLISGGISVGDHDHVHWALQDLGVEEVFYKVRQKPGKPFFFGKKGRCSVFALPGNPASALTCLYEYVVPHLRCMCAQDRPFGIRIELPLADDIEVKADRDLFLKARIEDGQLVILDSQASSMLRSFAIADGLVYIPEGKGRLVKGQLLNIHLLR